MQRTGHVFSCSLKKHSFDARLWQMTICDYLWDFPHPSTKAIFLCMVTVPILPKDWFHRMFSRKIVKEDVKTRYAVHVMFIKA